MDGWLIQSFEWPWVAHGSGLPVCTTHARHALLPGRPPAQSRRKNRFAFQLCCAMVDHSEPTPTFHFLKNLQRRSGKPGL